MRFFFEIFKTPFHPPFSQSTTLNLSLASSASNHSTTPRVFAIFLKKKSLIASEDADKRHNCGRDREHGGGGARAGADGLGRRVDDAGGVRLAGRGFVAAAQEDDRALRGVVALALVVGKRAEAGGFRVKLAKVGALEALAVLRARRR